MAPSRLTDSQKQELLERYRAGETSAALADTFGCSTNTVSRTVRTLLSPEEYSALKTSRSRGASPAPQPIAAADISPELEAPEPEASPSELVDPEDQAAEEDESADDDSPSTLALDDADDFGADEPEDISDDDDASLSSVDTMSADDDSPAKPAAPKPTARTSTYRWCH